MLKRIFSKALIIIGLICCALPLGCSIYDGFTQRSVLSSFDSEVEELDHKDVEKALADAKEYNSLLWQSKGAIVGDVDANFYSDEHYNSLLNLTGTGVMGSIQIPKINVNLPIYHGTEDEILSKGVGHFKGSSLPVGGENTRSILTAHRGLPNSKLFTRLDEMEEGDLIFLDVADEKLAYQVEDIEIIDPDEMDKLDMQAEKDLITLVTCTPYGINTHRLLVTAKRVPYQERMEDTVKAGMPSWREILFAALPFIFILIVLYRPAKDYILRKRKKRDDD